MRVFTLDGYRRLSDDEQAEFREWCAIHHLRHTVMLWEEDDELRAVCYATNEQGSRYLADSGDPPSAEPDGNGALRPARIGAEVVVISRPARPFPFFDREPAKCG